MNEIMSSGEEVQPGHAPPASVTADEVRRVAELANLELTAEELPSIERDLNAILGYIAQLNALDTAGVLPMAQVGELLTTTSRATLEDGQALRIDRIQASLDRGSVLAAAPESDGAFFKVPKVIER